MKAYDFPFCTQNVHTQSTQKWIEFTGTGDLNIFMGAHARLPCVCTGTDHHFDVIRWGQVLVQHCTLGEEGFARAPSSPVSKTKLASGTKFSSDADDAIYRIYTKF